MRCLLERDRYNFICGYATERMEETIFRADVVFSG